jgi:hypothetical protein
MPSLCAPFYPFLAVGGAIALCLLLILRRLLHVRRRKRLAFDQQSGLLLLIMFASALLGTGLLFVYILSPHAAC